MHKRRFPACFCPKSYLKPAVVTESNNSFSRKEYNMTTPAIARETAEAIIASAADGTDAKISGAHTE